MRQRDDAGRFLPVCPTCGDTGLVEVCFNNDPSREATVTCECRAGQALANREVE